jgi:endonuclease YncB( thermonuclease family)
MHDFHRQRAITDHYVPGRRDRERDYIRWFFEELATAEAFAAQFSGTLVTPHSEPAAWGVRIGEIANAVALRAMRHARLLYVLVPLSLIVVVGALSIKRPEIVEKMDVANADAKIEELKISREQQTQDSGSRAVVSSARVKPDVVRVIDGDTIRIGHQKPDIRLVGFNAPETRRAQCKAERRLGDRATARLRDLVRSSKLDFEFVACSCPPGTEGTSTCNYGRRCGTLKANGQDVGSILIQENLAVPFVCGQTRCPPIPKPWCR